jgi:hypothetical protein
MKRLLLFATLALAALTANGQAPVPASTPAPAENHDLGFTDTPMLPGLPWHVHDPDRPHPPAITPSDMPGGAPSDAIVLFDGKDLSHWTSHASTITHAGNAGPPEWKLGDGYMEAVPHTGDLATKEKFGDIQLHVEWSSPNPPKGNSQARGNSGILLMGRYEVQVLDPWNNPTYADGQAAAIYGQWPPLANPGRKPGEWNVYDIVFEAPRLDGDQVLKPAVITVFFNGVLVQNHKESMGPMIYRQVAHYVAQPAEDSLMLQNHNDPVRYRNIWVRRVPPYDRK